MAFPAATRMTAFLAELSRRAGGLSRCPQVAWVRPLQCRRPRAFPADRRLFSRHSHRVCRRHREPVSGCELKTRVRFVYFPITRAGWAVMFNCWGRMLAWFLGRACRSPRRFPRGYLAAMNRPTDNFAVERARFARCTASRAGGSSHGPAAMRTEPEQDSRAALIAPDRGKAIAQPAGPRPVHPVRGHAEASGPRRQCRRHQRTSTSTG